MFMSMPSMTFYHYSDMDTRQGQMFAEGGGKDLIDLGSSSRCLRELAGTILVGRCWRWRVGLTARTNRTTQNLRFIKDSSAIIFIRKCEAKELWKKKKFAVSWLQFFPGVPSLQRSPLRESSIRRCGYYFTFDQSICQLIAIKPPHPSGPIKW